MIHNLILNYGLMFFKFPASLTSMNSHHGGYAQLHRLRATMVAWSKLSSVSTEIKVVGPSRNEGTLKGSLVMEYS